MRVIWILLATTTVAVWSVPLTKPSLEDALSRSVESSRNENNAIESLLAEVLELLRGIIVNGMNPIPPLDPLSISNIELDDQIIPLPGARLALADLTLSNLGTFEVDNLGVTMTSLLLQQYRLLLDVRIPNLKVDADYYNLSVSALGFNIYGVGDLKINLIDPKISTNLLVRLRLSDGGIFLNLVATEIKFSIQGFKTEITGLFGHNGASDFVNLFLGNLVPTLVAEYEPVITEFLSTNLHQIANTILANLNLADLISP